MTKPQSNTNIIDDDILGGGQPVQQAPVQQTYQQPQQQTFVPQPTVPVQNTSAIDLGFSFDTPAVKPQPVTQPVTQPVQQMTQPVVTQPQQPQVNPIYQVQTPQTNFGGLNMGYNAPTTLPQQPSLYGQQNIYGYQQTQSQFPMYPQQPPGGLYGQPYQQPMAMGGYNPQQGLGFGQTPQYQQPQSIFYCYF